MNPLSSAFREIRPSIVSAAVISLFINLLVFVSPIYTMQIYDRVLTTRNVTTLVMISAIVAVLFVCYAALEHYRSAILVNSGVLFDRALSARAFRAAFSSALKTKGSNHAQALRDVDTLKDVLSGSVLTTLLDLPWAPLYLFVCFLLDPLIGLVATVGALFIVLIAFINEKLTKKHLTQAMMLNIKSLDQLNATLRNAEVLQALGMADDIQTKWRETREESIKSGMLAGERGGTLLSFSKFLRLAVQAAVMGTGAYLALSQKITGGSLFAASLIMGRALAPVESIVGQWKAFVSARGAYDRLKELFTSNKESSFKMVLPTPAGELTLQSLSIVAPGAKTVTLANVSFALEAGDCLAIVGPTGSGKSSLARALVGAWQPYQGFVRLDGSELRHYNADQLGRCLGYLPQDVELLAGSIRDNIARFRTDITDEQVVQASQRASCHQMIQNLPEGYNTTLGEDGMTLSGGQRQRIGLARAMLGNPSLVVLDEPNANLDREGDIALARAIESLQSELTTIVIVTHRPNLLTLVDKIIVIQDGRVLRMGTREELMPLLSGQAPQQRLAA